MKKAGALDDRLISVDALGKRWAAWGRDRNQTPLHPLEAMRLMHDGAVLGGGPTGMPDDVKAWDICIEGEALVREHRALLKTWYTRGDMPITVLADRLGIARPTVYNHYSSAMFSMRTALKVYGVKL